MKTTQFLIGLFAIFLSIACSHNQSDPEYSIEAIVLGKNADCGIDAIKITKGLSAVESITNSVSNDSIYIAKNLPEDLQTAGLKISLEVRDIKDSELSACTHLGISYSWLFVLKAAEK